MMLKVHTTHHMSWLEYYEEHLQICEALDCTPLSEKELTTTLAMKQAIKDDINDRRTTLSLRRTTYTPF